MVRLAICLAWLAVALPAAQGASPRGGEQGLKSAAEVAARVDQQLAADLKLSAERLVPASDEIYLRRLWLDLLGVPPTPEEITAFVLDPAADKRSRAIERGLARPELGANWARYWRDVFLYRRVDDRALASAESCVQYLTEQFNADARWDEVARSFITAEGSLSGDGRTALIAAQWGQAVDVASEVSRVLLGIQIQCAQCHDHKTDRWKREQFHELAAFFPRMAVRREIVDGVKGDFELVSVDRPRKPKGKPAAPGGEYFMPDLEDPSVQGTVMQPVFFATGKSMELGADDHERREALAQWLTAPASRWFAKAYVNRVWGELTGQGFYEPLDDLGPDRTCVAPAALETLSEEFVRHQYRVKWLFDTVARTNFYQRSRAAEASATSAAIAADCPKRLRADEIFSTLARVLGAETEAERAQRKEMRPGALLQTPRAQFGRVFGYDPSTPPDELSGSIAQALVMMNFPGLQRLVSARADLPLGQLLDSTNDNDEVVTELYLRCLAREPSDEERKICRDYLSEVSDRREAFEDILWSLLNSTEFLYRR